MRPSTPELVPTSTPTRARRAFTIARLRPEHPSTIVEDARRGLLAPPRRMPPKHLYDEVGCALFDRICELDEYYPTRAEAALLARHAEEIAARTRARELVELGSGSARKTGRLLRALAAHGAKGGEVAYVPLDIAESALAAAAQAVTRAVPSVRVHAFVCDFTAELPLLPLLPSSTPRLFAFLGGTVGNFEDDEAGALLGAVAARMRPDDAFLVGFDRVKPVARLLRAYDDALGVTAAFDKNLLAVMNRALGADFDASRFAHEARWDPARARIEMHLRSTCAQRVRLAALDARIELAAGETIHTEISRKFTRDTAAALLARGGLALDAWLADDDFALALART